MTDGRLKPLSSDEMTPAQRRVADAFAAGPRGHEIRGPFAALLRTPELCDRVQRTGEYVRYQSSLPPAIREFIILLTARHWGADYEWYAHHELALKAGLAPAICDAVAEGRHPASMSPQETAVHTFVTELYASKRLGDENFTRVKELFGEAGIMEIVGTMGHYCMIALVLNADRHPIPAAAKPLPPLPA